MLTKLFRVVVILLIGVSTLHSQQSEYCHDKIYELGIVQCGEWIGESRTISYLNCPISIGYSKRVCTVDDPNDECPARTVMQIGIGSVNWNWDSCLSLTQMLFPGYPDNFGQLFEDAFSIMIAQLSRDLARIAFEDWYNGLPPNQQSLVNCEQPDCTVPECPPFEVLMSNSPCNMLCWGFNRSAPSGNPSFRITWLPCDDNGLTCCTSTRAFCMCNGQAKMTTLIPGGYYEVCDPPVLPPWSYCVGWEGYEMFTSDHCVVMCP
jgi:hypothetical protein